MVKKKEEERRINPMPKRRRLALMDGPGVDSASASLSAPPSATSYRSASIVHSFIHSFVGSWAPSRHSTRRRRRQSQQGNAGGIFLVFFFSSSPLLLSKVIHFGEIYSTIHSFVGEARGTPADSLRASMTLRDSITISFSIYSTIPHQKWEGRRLVEIVPKTSHWPQRKRGERAIFFFKRTVIESIEF